MATQLSGTIEKCYGASGGCWAGVLKDEKGESHRFAGNKLAGLGDKVTFSGSWNDDPKWGPQFKVAKTESHGMDQSRSGILGFLDQLPNVGPVRAATIYKQFGEQTFNVIENDPGRLSEAPGITSRMTSEIHDAYMNLKSERDLMVYLNGLGLTAYEIRKIITQYGQEAPKVIESNPYQLIEDIHGFGFVKVDNIARKAGVSRTSPYRVRAGILFTLSESMNDGHVFLTKDELLQKACKLLQVPAALVVEAVTDLEADELIVIEEPDRVFSAELWEAEQDVAMCLRDVAMRGKDKS